MQTDAAPDWCAVRLGDRVLRTRPALGLLLPDLSENSDSLWMAAVEAAHEEDVNLIALQTGNATQEPDTPLWTLIDSAYVDALIVAPDNLSIPYDQVQAFLARFSPMPVVSLGTLVPGVPSVLSGSRYGMRAVVRHLIEAHGLQRIAYTHGLIGVAWAEARYQGYCDALASAGIPLDPILIVPPTGGNAWFSGDRVLRILLDERGLRPGIDFEAIVMCHDPGARSLIRSLQERGVRVPQDMRVTGYDDLLVAQATSPSITSVNQPQREVARCAIHLALAQLRGRDVPPVTHLSPRLVVRRSCGCGSRAVARVAQPAPADGPDPVRAAFEQIGIDDQAGQDLVSAFDAAVIGAGCTQETQPDVPTFATQWEALLEAHHAADTGVGHAPGERIAGGVSPEGWHAVISALRWRCERVDLGPAARACAETLLHEARAAVEEQYCRLHLAELLHVEEQARALRSLNAGLISTLDLEHSMALLADGLADLHIPAVWLAVREGSPAATRWQRLVLHVRDGQRVAVPPAYARYPITVLLPPELLPQREPYSLVVAPLHFRDVQLGLIILEVGPKEGRLYDELRVELSGILRAHHLYEEALRAQDAAEQANKLKTRLMANVSHELRAPLHVILRQSRVIQSGVAYHGDGDGGAPGSEREILDAIRHIQTNAEYQLRMVNDLLDLSRAEISELTLSLTLIDPRPFLEEVFLNLASLAGQRPAVAWQLKLPAHLPAINADPDRLRQILYNLLSNAARFTEAGHIVLGAESTPSHLHIWIEDTGAGIPEEQQERIFEPFVTGEGRDRRSEGVGLGLTIARRLVALHGGSMALESREVGSGPDHGSTFHVYLPLPSRRRTAVDDRSDEARHRDPVLVFVAAACDEAIEPSPEVIALAETQGLSIYRLQPDEDIDAMLTHVTPLLLAWEGSPAACDLTQLQRLCGHPRLSQVPCIFLGTQAMDTPDDEELVSVGPIHTSAKPVNETTLLGAIAVLGRQEDTRAPATNDAVSSILIVDDDPAARQSLYQIIATNFPTRHIEIAGDGTAGVAAMMRRTPSIVILDLNMPEMNGFEVLDWMRAYPRTRRLPVMILSGRTLTLDDIKRLEQYAHVTLHSKGILSGDETAAALHQALFCADELPTQTSVLVKRAVAYFQQNYDQALTRSMVADEIGVSNDYLSTIFKRELGLTLWDYLNRYRITCARRLLDGSNQTITEVAHAVGFDDPAYFSRIFRRLVGMSPSAYREKTP
jgi:signal transduction histidine kinase/DNA-binding LacI/PurR family transcriptional regulator/AraC-like DNA-binding protein/ActR/RegA family two-component response regulator